MGALVAGSAPRCEAGIAEAVGLALAVDEVLGGEVGLWAGASAPAQPRAASPSSAFAMMTCWIWLVPS